MSATTQRAIDVFERLGESAQFSVLKFAEFLAAESDADIAAYDEAKLKDDGYRISSEDLRKKYGV
jgi:hypothetical protein